uniref:Uncharacterized protein n=1 Tax=Falco tinnunculus TaxID=100819 RepID=A0A8C4UFU8_FALTI
ISSADFAFLILWTFQMICKPIRPNSGCSADQLPRIAGPCPSVAASPQLALPPGGNISCSSHKKEARGGPGRAWLPHGQAGCSPARGAIPTARCPGWPVRGIRFL